eukprot:scaffold24467_cov108-Skeletonema_dohrnii-CCMP3373.AAC.6
MSGSQMRRTNGKDGGGGKDLQVLQNEYKHMQVNRNAFANESELVLRKQQTTLNKLRAENETLKTDVARLQTRSMTRPINSFEQSQLDKLYQELDKYSCLVEAEKAKAAAMEKDVGTLRDEIWKRHKEMGGVNAAANNTRLLEKQSRMLESRLDQALVKFNKCVSRNKMLRKEIDCLRGDRVTYEKVYKKLENVRVADLKEQTRQMALVIEQSNQAYEQRDRAQLEMAALEQANRKEEDAYHEQLTELIDELENVNEQLLSSTRQQTAMIDPDEEERKEVEREEAERAIEIANAEKECAQQRKERMENFQDAFHQISVATGISDVDELVKVFIKNEEQNFSLFSYLNEQAGEIERLEDDIQSLQEEKAQYEEANANNIEQNDEILKIENRIKTTEEQTTMYETKVDAHNKTLDRVKDEIKLLMMRLDCKVDSQEGEIAVTTENILPYLGIIEEKTIAIISEYLKMKEMRQPNNIGMRLMHGGRNTQSCLQINPPRLVDYSSDESGDDGDEESLKPLHRENINHARISKTFKGKRKTFNGGRRGSLYRRSTVGFS